MTTHARKSTRHRPTVSVDLALQGGGSHGAFTWGVLDRLLEEEWLKIEGVSGTSAGAMNAAVMVLGHARGGVQGAKDALESFWRRVSRDAMMSPFKRSPMDVVTGEWSLDHSPAFILFNMMAGMLSPYQFNLAGLNPLKSILQESIDFEELAQAPIHLFITATNVRTGQGRVFHNDEVTEDVLLASACLPTIFQAIEIDGDPYWDGGYSGNPSITPLVLESESEDTILIQINPVEREGIPKTSGEIMNRLNEISFNATLLKELKMIALLRRVVNSRKDEGARWASMRMHLITSDIMNKISYSSKLNAEWAFLTMLKDEGRRAAEEFLLNYGDDVGQRPSLDIDQLINPTFKSGEK